MGWFMLITIGLVISFATLVYWTSAESRERAFFELLRNEALTKVNLALQSKMDPDILQEIYRNNRQFIKEVEVAIYDANHHLVYHDDKSLDQVKETPQMLDQILNEEEIRFTEADYQVIGIRIRHQGQNFLVTAAAYDEYGFKKLNLLGQQMIWICLIFLGLSWFGGWWMAYTSLEPVHEILAQAKRISTSQLHVRLPENQDRKDELSDLTQTINQLLDRLEKSFEAQKLFVSHVAHELRTPLARMIVELELATHQEEMERRRSIENTLGDARKLVKLTKSLLDLAKASYDASEIYHQPVRLDELLFESKISINTTWPQARLDFHLDDLSDVLDTPLQGNPYLLQVAFENLMENAVKFSPNASCEIDFYLEDNNFHVRFKNQGGKILDPKNIFRPFYREKRHVEGHGIGLYLVQKIMELHGGTITLDTSRADLVCFWVRLPIASF